MYKASIKANGVPILGRQVT